MSDYSKIAKGLHRFYLGNPFLSKTSFEIEETLYESKFKKNEVLQKVFVTGLARSGTTAFMRTIFQSGVYASLQYANMPFLFLPNLWKNKQTIISRERAHKDGIQVNQNSPEAFDEYFWKVFLKNKYITENALVQHEISNEIIEKYEVYLSLICLSKNKNRYLSKNNNTILRLHTIAKLASSTIFILYRDPLNHAASLLKLHLFFSKQQQQDPFIKDYFNYLGHHEFGNNHKPFVLQDNLNMPTDQYKEHTINYWLLQWKNYYTYVLNNVVSNCVFISFKDIVQYPEKVYAQVYKELNLDTTDHIFKKHSPKPYTTEGFSQELLASCQHLYEQLNALKKYNIDSAV